MDNNVVYLRKDKSVIFAGLSKEQLAFLAHVVSLYAQPPSLVTPDTLGFIQLGVIQTAVQTAWLRHLRYGDVLSEHGVLVLLSLPKAFTVQLALPSPPDEPVGNGRNWG